MIKGVDNMSNTYNNDQNKTKFHWRGPERYYAVAGRQLDEKTNDGTDGYIKEQSKPLKITLITLAALTILALAIIVPIWRGTFVNAPFKLSGNYTPAVYDDAGLISNMEPLTETLNEFYDLTGICPVIYTVYDEDWENDYYDVKTFTNQTYLDNFKDGKHFVVVFSVKKDEADQFRQGNLDNLEYTWASIKGKSTNGFFTSHMIYQFVNTVETDRVKGQSCGVAINDAFQVAVEDAQGRIITSLGGKIKYCIVDFLPLVIVLVVFAVIFIIVIRKYRKEKNAWKEDEARTDARLA